MCHVLACGLHVRGQLDPTDLHWDLEIRVALTSLLHMEVEAALN